MSRRRQPDASSLELLLDTICNTFGGVLFIAIMVVLLLRQAGDSTASPSAESTPQSPLEIQTMANHYEEIAGELARLQQNRNSQDDVVRTFAPEATQLLFVRRNEVTRQQESLRAEIDRMIASIASMAAHVDELEVENQGIKQTLAETKSRYEAQVAQLDEDRKKRVENIRMPVVRNGREKPEIGLVMHYGRLYVWRTYGYGAVPTGLNLKDFVVTGEEKGGLVVEPNPLAGISVNESEQSRTDVRRVLSPFDPKECYLVIIVRPDSYGAFKHLRDQAVEMGFEYRLMPAYFDVPIYSRGGRGGQVQ